MTTETTAQGAIQGPLRLARIDARDGQRFAVLALKPPPYADAEVAARIAATILQPSKDDIAWMLGAGYYTRDPMSAVDPERPPERPLGDLIVDLYTGQTYRILRERAIPLPLVIETRALAVQLH